MTRYSIKGLVAVSFCLSLASCGSSDEGYIGRVHAARKLTKGTVLQAADLRMNTNPAPTNPGDLTLLDDVATIPFAVGKTLTEDLSPGDHPLTYQMLDLSDANSANSTEHYQGLWFTTKEIASGHKITKDDLRHAYVHDGVVPKDLMITELKDLDGATANHMLRQGKIVLKDDLGEPDKKSTALQSGSVIRVKPGANYVPGDLIPASALVVGPRRDGEETKSFASVRDASGLIVNNGLTDDMVFGPDDVSPVTKYLWKDAHDFATLMKDTKP